MEDTKQPGPQPAPAPAVDMGPAAALYAALAKAQGQFQPIVKNRDVVIAMKSGGSYRFRYADLEEITAKTRPALSQNGLALVQTVEHGQQGPLLVCRLMHAQGGMMASEVTMPTARDLGDPKAFGAAITYLRRYMVTAMLGVAADDDLDEDGQEMQQGQDAQKKPAGRGKAAALPVCPAENFAKKLPTWKKQVADGGAVADLLAMLQSKYTLSAAQIDEITALAPSAAPATAAGQEARDEFVAQL
jgi:hypothetical protein